MAGAEHLKRRARRRWWTVLGLVLLLHAVGLDWLGRQLHQSALLHPMVVPMFTRLLQPEAPTAPPVVAQVEPAARAARPEIRSIESHPRAHKRKRPASAPVEADRAAPPPPTPPKDGTETAAPQPTTAAAPDSSASAASPQAAASAAAAPQAAASAPAPAASSAPVDAPAVANLDDWPVDTRLHYRLGGQYRGELHGWATVQWLRQDDRYETRIDIELPLLVGLVVTSQGRVTTDGLQPAIYEELRRNGVRTARLREDTIVLGNGRVVPRPPGVQDTASQFVELAHRFLTGRDALEVGRSVSFWMARPGGVDEWTYDIVEREILQTPELGPVEAFHLKPHTIANPRGNITAEMWFAPSLHYLPVRIKVMMGDTAWVDLIVEKIEQR